MAVIVVGPNQVVQESDEQASSEVSPDQVRVRPRWVGLCGSDFHLVSGHLKPPKALGPIYPRRLGHEFSGIVEDIGASVTSIQKGDQVAIWPLTESCGTCKACLNGRPNACPLFKLTGVHADGALGAFVDVNEEQIVKIPDEMSGIVGALCEPLSIALSAVEKSGLSAGDTVLIMGSGAIGLCALIAAKQLGTRVIVSEPHIYRRDIALEVGADALADGSSDSIRHGLRQLGIEAVDHVLECTGIPTCVTQGLDVLDTLGTLTLVGLSGDELSVPINRIARSELNIVGSSVCNKPTFERAVELAVGNEAKLRRLVSHIITPEEVAQTLTSPPGEEHIKVVVRL